MLRIIKWKSEIFKEDKPSINICTKNTYISSGKWEGLYFSIQGLGLTKCEREIFDKKFFSFDGNLTIYFLKWYLSYNKKGIYDSFKNVDIIYNRTVKSIIKDKLNNIKSNIKEFMTYRQFKQEYTFSIVRSFEGEYTFKSDMLTAFRLASNYEADLFLNNRIIYSPLGFEYEENLKLVKKYLGNRFINNNRYDLKGYADPWSNRIKNYKEVTTY